jgi:mannobiose 2-epimerase
MTDVISFGHDIEASWLLCEAAEETGNKQLCEKIKPLVLKITEIALLEDFDPMTGAMESEIRGRAEDLPHGCRDRTCIWWCRAEAMVGFLTPINFQKMKGFLMPLIINGCG